jgi:hypothetical protein
VDTQLRVVLLLLLGVPRHGAELQQGEATAEPAGSLLSEENGPRTLELSGGSEKRKERQQDGQQEASQDHVKRTLYILEISTVPQTLKHERDMVRVQTVTLHVETEQEVTPAARPCFRVLGCERGVRIQHDDELPVSPMAKEV